MTKEKTDKDISDAVLALREWLISQDLCPSDGFRVFCRMMAWCMVDKSTDAKDLSGGIDAITSLIEWEVRVILSNKVNDRKDLAT